MKGKSKFNIMSSSDMRLAVKHGISGIYIFCGPEEYMLQSCLKMIKDKLLGADGENDVFAYTRIDRRRQQRKTEFQRSIRRFVYGFAVL